MSINFAELKVKKDAAVSALFSLWKAAGDASSATLELIDYLEGLGLDVDDLRAALDGTPQRRTKLEVASPGVPPAEEQVATTQSTAEPTPAAIEHEEEDQGVKKRKRAPRDPNLPKRPLNVQLRFHNSEQKKIQEERKAQSLPELSRAELRDEVKTRWEKLDPKVRDELLKEHQVALEKWHAQTAAYKDTAAGANAESLSQTQESAGQEPASQEPPSHDSAEGETATQATPSKKKHRKSEGKKDEKKRRKKSTESE